MEILFSLLEEGTTEDTVWLLPQGYFILGREGNRKVWALFLFSRRLSLCRLLYARTPGSEDIQAQCKIWSKKQ